MPDLDDPGFNLDEAIANWRRKMAAGGIRLADVLDELECHLHDDIEHQMRSGTSARQAFESAIGRIGQAALLKNEFTKAGRSKWALLRQLKALFDRHAGTELPILCNCNPAAMQALELAEAESTRFYHDYIGTEHVLLSILKSGNGIVPKILRRFGVDQDAVRTKIEKIVHAGPVHEMPESLPYTPRARQALRLAAAEAKMLHHPYVGNEHILLGLLIEGGGVAALVLKNLGVPIEKMRQEILKELNSNPEN
jgi:hypothetical protein